MAQERSVFDLSSGIRLFTAAHEFWYRSTNGIIGGWAGAPMLLLTTTGRKSGERRTTPLLFMRDGDDYVVIASYGGSDDHPQWWKNLRKNPVAQVQAFAERRTVHAEAATGAERERLWADIKRRYPIYAWYEGRTSREIPVVVLRPETR